MSLADIIGQLPGYVFNFLATFPPIRDLWWFWSFLIIFFTARAIWRAYIHEYYALSIKWTLIEIKIPREGKRPPRAMEQVFMTMHAVKNSASDFQEEWWDGEMPLWFSCEAVSFGGEVHLYMSVPEVRRRHIEASLYAQYPDVEISVVDDYIGRLPPTITELNDAGYKLFGNELILANKDVYPIMTYLDFEANIEEKELDPVAALLETLSRIKPQEHIWLQILVRPLVDDFITDWHKEGEDEVKAIQERTGKRKMFSPQFGEFVIIDRAPQDVEDMKAISKNIEKPAFDVVIRYIYVAPKDMYTATFGRRSILSAFNQYASETFNKFKHNTRAWTISKIWYFPHVFPKRRAKARSIRLYQNFRERNMYPHTAVGTLLKLRAFDWGFRPKRAAKMILNVEELATIYHLPTMPVLTGPLIKRVEAKKGGPPAGLPIYGEGEEELPL